MLDLVYRAGRLLDGFLWHLKQIAIAVDQLCNSLLGGWADETLSSRCWRWEQDGKRSWPRKLIDTIFWFDPCHCYESYLSERRGNQLPPELRPRLRRRKYV